MFFEKKYIILSVICTFYAVVMFICGIYLRSKRMKILCLSNEIVSMMQTVSRTKEHVKFCLNIAIVIMFGCALADIAFGRSNIVCKSILLGMLALEQFISRRRGAID